MTLKNLIDIAYEFHKKHELEFHVMCYEINIGKCPICNEEISK